MNAIPLSRRLIRVGVHWLMTNARTRKEARRLEQIFANSLREIDPEEIERVRTEMNKLRMKMGFPSI